MEVHRSARRHSPTLKEINKVYARIEKLDHVCRQMKGTIEVFIKLGKIEFFNSEVEKTFYEIMAKWAEELGPKRRGRKVA